MVFLGYAPSTVFAVLMAYFLTITHRPQQIYICKTLRLIFVTTSMLITYDLPFGKVKKLRSTANEETHMVRSISNPLCACA